jgi:hypothetical protein
LFGENQEEAVKEPAFVEIGQIGDVNVFHRGDRETSTGRISYKGRPAGQA